MCRLFGLHGGERVVSATFWLLDAPLSLAAQSRTQPDGYGLGAADDDGSPAVDGGAVRALEENVFASEARQKRANCCTFPSTSAARRAR